MHNVTRHSQHTERAKQKDRSRQRIVQATIDVMGEKGVAGTTVRSIIKRAGVSRGLVTYHFGTKRELLLAAFRSLNEEYLAPLRDAVAQRNDRQQEPEDVLKDAIRRHLELDYSVRARNRQFAWFGFFSMSLAIPEIADMDRESYEEVVRLLGGLLATAAAKRGRRLDPDAAGRALNVSLEGAWLELTVGRSRFTTEDAVHACIQHAQALLDAAPPDSG